MKAITITKDNIGLLATRFAVEEDDYDDRLPLGFVLVTDFGNDETFDVITQARFEDEFSVQNELGHDWLDIVAA